MKVKTCEISVEKYLFNLSIENHGLHFIFLSQCSIKQTSTGGILFRLFEQNSLLNVYKKKEKGNHLLIIY